MKIINDLLEAIDATTAEFLQSFGNLNEQQLNAKPSPAAWSIAQNIDHLIVINKTYLPVIADVRAGRYTLPWIGRFDFLVKFFGKIILDSVSPDRRKKMKTFPLWEPSKSNIGADILDRFRSHQEALKALITANADLIEKNTKISSPANKNIVYYLGTAFEIIVTHERRHLEQAKEVKKLLNL